MDSTVNIGSVTILDFTSAEMNDELALSKCFITFSHPTEFETVRGITVRWTEPTLRWKVFFGAGMELVFTYHFEKQIDKETTTVKVNREHDTGF